MLRKQTRRSFTVETKHGAHHGHAHITAKAPRAPRKLAASAHAAPSPDLAAHLVAAPAGTVEAEPRRILPSLVTWEPSAPEPAATLPPEPPLPRVRRVEPSALDAPRRRGRPRKVVLEPVDAPVVPDVTPPVSVPVAVPSSAARPPRDDRSKTLELPRGERWKRRLPRACW